MRTQLNILALSAPKVRLPKFVGPEHRESIEAYDIDWLGSTSIAARLVVTHSKKPRASS